MENEREQQHFLIILITIITKKVCKVLQILLRLARYPLSILYTVSTKERTELRFSRCIYKTTDVQRAERGLYLPQIKSSALSSLNKPHIPLRVNCECTNI